jgi:mannose-6-phosphate isomerase
MLYPLKFHPILKPAPWGGTQLLAKGTPGDVTPPVGESWELSAVGGHLSVVANGPLAGINLRELATTYTTALLGHTVHARHGADFPLLLKYIDARDNLSIQVHPDDATALQRHGTPGKTEMWYVVEADPGATLVLGLERPVTREEFLAHLAGNRLAEILHVEPARAGDCFFVPAGLLHAIGRGCFIAEIQQSSDITYRVHDYDRRDASGKPRELHVELAADVIDYGKHPAFRVTRAPCANRPERLVACPYFTTSLIDIDTPVARDYASLDSFVIYMCIEGTFTIVTATGTPVTVSRGETVLLPAALDNVTLRPAARARLLEIYIE